METQELTKDQIAAKLALIKFNEYESIIKEIAKRTKEKKLSSGTMSFEQFRNKIAQNLLKPSCKPVLQKVLSLKIIV